MGKKLSSVDMLIIDIRIDRKKGLEKKVINRNSQVKILQLNDDNNSLSYDIKLIINNVEEFL